jgi:hypothetical protein
MTAVDTLYDAHYGSREKLAWAFAEILNEEALAIEAAGIDVIQFDEPAFNVYFDEVRDWGIAALERAAQGLACRTAVHICYGYGIKANNDWKKTLGNEWRQYEKTFPLLARSRLGQVSLECANSHVPLELIGLLDGKDVLVGGHRCRQRPDRDGRPGRRDSAPRSNMSGRTGCCPAPIAGWSLGLMLPAASWPRWPKAPPASGRSLESDVFVQQTGRGSDR